MADMTDEDIDKLYEEHIGSEQPAAKPEEVPAEASVAMPVNADAEKVMQEYNALKSKHDKDLETAKWTDAMARVAGTVIAPMFGGQRVDPVGSYERVAAGGNKDLQGLLNQYKALRATDVQKQKMAMDEPLKKAQIRKLEADAKKAEREATQDMTAWQKELARHYRAGEDIEKAKMEMAKSKVDEKSTEGQKTLDRTFGKDAAEFIAAGGYTDVKQQLDQLRESARELEKNKDLTGPITGRLPVQVRSLTNPASVDLQQKVEQTVQRNLRAVLGAQFTEKEGERLISRAFDPTLPADVNLKRIHRVADQIEAAAKAKLQAADYFDKNGTLKGYTGKIVTNIDDVLSDNKAKNSAPKASPDKVVVEKDGKQFRLPASQLEDALAQGYKKVE